MLSSDHRLLTRGLSSPATLGDYGLADWQARALGLRRELRWWTGPAPRLSWSSVQVFVQDAREYEGIIVERLVIETFPGARIGANLFRPKGSGPFPAIAHAHGHWPDGRLTNGSDASTIALSANLAFRGYVVLSYDMVGYGDSRHLSHSFAESDPEAEQWGISLLGVQFQNSMACLDYLSRRPEVDQNRLGCVGASGGATQALLLAALDDRIKVVSLLGMISATCQGWCGCENAPGLRVETNNLEMAALIAPRPLLLVSASGDWTKDTPENEFPKLRRAYGNFGAADRVANVHVDASHNLNSETRGAVYRWFDRWLAVERHADQYLESAFPVAVEALHVTSEERAASSDAAMMSSLRQAAAGDAQVSELHETTRERLQLCVGLDIAESATVEAITTAQGDSGIIGDKSRILIRRARQELVSLREFGAGGAAGAALVIVGATGSAGTLNELRKEIGELVEGGCCALLPDPFLNPAWATRNGRMGRNHDVRYFSTYNRTDSAEQIRDVVSTIDYAATALGSRVRLLVGRRGQARIALAAAALRVDVDEVLVDASEFETGESGFFVPGLLRAGGPAAFFSLICPRPLTLINAPDDLLHLARSAYREHAGSLRETGESVGSLLMSALAAGR